MDELYVMSRGVLLDALDALGDHRRAVVLVGAQAVYLRAGESDLAVAPFTTDGDLAINPHILTEIPPLETALRGAGFTRGNQPGTWVTHRTTQGKEPTPVAVDLLVPQAVSPGTGRRAARLPGHDPDCARIAKGLEGALVDADALNISALDPSDGRSHEVLVAGPAALIIAKVHKIAERVGTNRLKDKDALDVYRLLRGTETADVSARFKRVLADDRARDVAGESIELLNAQFSDHGSQGVQMVIRAIGELADAEEVSASCTLLAKDLLAAIRQT